MRFELFVDYFKEKLGPQGSNLSWILSRRGSLVMNLLIFICRETKWVRVVISLKTKKVAVTCVRGRYVVILWFRGALS